MFFYLHFCSKHKFCVYSRVVGVGDFKYAIQNFKGAKGIAMASKFGQNEPKLNKISCLDRIVLDRIVHRRNIVNC